MDPTTPPGRIDYFDDPDAPRASTLVPSVNLVVTNGTDDILLIRRTDNGSCALPGGAIDLGESVAQAAIRETLEVPRDRVHDHRRRRHLLRPQARDPLHQQRERYARSSPSSSPPGR